MKSDFIRHAPLFAGLNEEEQTVLAEQFTADQADADSPLFKAGDQGDCLYLIHQGFVRLTTASGQNLATLGPGSILGDESLFRSTVYDVNAIAVSPLEYWRLTDRQLRDILLVHPSIGIKLSRNFGTLVAQMEDYLVQLLSRTRELSDLPRHSLQVVAGRLQPRVLEAGEQLYAAGASPQGLFVVESGAFEVRAESNVIGDDAIKTVQAGAILGAAELLTNKNYASGAVALEDSQVWVLTADDFQTVNSRHPGLRRSLGRGVRSPLSKTDQAQAVIRLGQMPLFAEVAPQTIEAITRRMVLQHVPAGERVYRIGEAGDALYFVEQGEIELTAENAAGIVEELARVSGDGFFGEMSLLTGQIRTEDATATRNTNLWVLYKSDLDALSSQYPEIGKAMSQGVANRLSTGYGSTDIENFRNFPLLADLNNQDLQEVVRYLEPNRYRAGEQILRTNSPSDKLFLVDSGQVRVQALSGGSWLLGPGESFGERALLSSQPHNASVFAESDVDVWILNKIDLDMLMARYPSLAINMSRILSQRMNQQAEMAYDPAMVDNRTAYREQGAAATNMPERRGGRRRRRDGAVAEPSQRIGFGGWFAGLTTWGKIRFALLILLLIWLVGIAAPAALMSILQGTSMADSPGAFTTNSALRAVYNLGSYDVAAMDEDLAQAVAMADQRVPPTPTFTPFPTNTPVPTATPTITPTPLPTATPTPTTVPVTFFQAPAPAPAEPAPAQEEPPAPALPPRSLDSRLGPLGVNIEDAQVASGQPFWRLIDVVFLDEKESGGKHHIYVEVLDENGSRIVGQPVTVFWGDGSNTGPIEDKTPPDYGFNFQMYASGYAYNVKVEGLPSDTLKGAGMGDVENRFRGIHTSYKLVYKKTIMP